MKFYIHIFNCFHFENEPVESEEMRPCWFHINRLPFEKMWCDDPYWFPLLFQGKTFTGNQYNDYCLAVSLCRWNVYITYGIGRFNLSDEETITDYVLINQTDNITTKECFASDSEEENEEDYEQICYMYN